MEGSGPVFEIISFFFFWRPEVDGSHVTLSPAADGHERNRSPTSSPTPSNTTRSKQNQARPRAGRGLGCLPVQSTKTLQDEVFQLSAGILLRNVAGLAGWQWFAGSDAGPREMFP